MFRDILLTDEDKDRIKAIKQRQEALYDRQKKYYDWLREYNELARCTPDGINSFIEDINQRVNIRMGQETLIKILTED